MSSVRVAVRARPLNKRELDAGSKCIIEMRDKKTTITIDKSTALDDKKVFSKDFTYDYSYWSADSRDPHYVNQEQVFLDLGEDVLKSAFQGYNACIFAYGQTGSGKSYTMMGVPGASGLIPRICQALYDRIGKEDAKNCSYKTEVSYMEIYNERVRDLLRPASSKQLHNLRVREHPTEGPYVESLTKHLVSDYNALFELMELGNTHRVTAATKMNDVSSRSHAIFTINFTQATFDSNLPSETASRINLVDLAGSERAAATGATGERLKEGGNINRSLVTLGNVISTLAKISTQHGTRDKKVFIPYRDSVLTWLLKESLGGNSKTVMVAAISPADINYGETLSTLQYANRAKNIINKPTVNEDPNVKLIRELRAEIVRLKEMISNSETVGATPAITELEASQNLHRKEEQVAELTRSWTGKWFELHKIAKEHELALRSEGIKMTVGSELPHFIAMDNDILSTGVVIYHLQMGSTSIGTNGCDIDLAGPGLTEQHCTVEHVDGVVMLHPKHGECFINYEEVARPTKLNQGDFIQLGEAITFRFNHPKEALRLKQVEDHLSVPSIPVYNSPHHNRKLVKQQEETLEAERKKFEMQKLKIEQDFAEKAKLVQVELEREREKAKSEKEKYENEKAKLEHERKKLEQLKMEIQEREERNATALIVNKPLTDDSDNSLNIDKSVNTPDKDVNNTSTITHPTVCTEVHSSASSVSTTSTSVNASHGLVTNNMAATVLTVSSNEQVSLELHESIHSLEQTPAITNTELLEREKQLLLQKEKLDAMQAQLNGKLSGSDKARDGSTSEILQFVTEKEKLEQQRILLERAKFSAESKESALRGLEEHRKLEAALNDMKAELKTTSTSKENYETLKEENELIMREKSQLQERVTTLEEKLSKKRDQQLRRKDGSSSKDSKTRRRSVHMDVFGVDIVRYISRGSGLHHHYVYEVKLRLGKEQWNVYRKYEQFYDLHKQMKMTYPELEALAFPPPTTKWFKWLKRGENEEFLRKRQKDLELYLQSFFAVCASIPHCPLANTKESLSSKMLTSFHTFFSPNIMESTLPSPSLTGTDVI